MNLSNQVSYFKLHQLRHSIDVKFWLKFSAMWKYLFSLTLHNLKRSFIHFWEYSDVSTFIKMYVSSVSRWSTTITEAVMSLTLTLTGELRVKSPRRLWKWKTPLPLNSNKRKYKNSVARGGKQRETPSTHLDFPSLQRHVRDDNAIMDLSHGRELVIINF